MIRNSLLILGIISALSGCFGADNYDPDKLAQLVEKESTVEDVTQLLGEPKQVLRSPDSQAYVYEYKNYLFSFTFYDGVLLFKERADNDGLYNFEIIKAE